jgi:hypothetical protein
MSQHRANLTWPWVVSATEHLHRQADPAIAVGPSGRRLCSWLAPEQVLVPTWARMWPRRDLPVGRDRRHVWDCNRQPFDNIELGLAAGGAGTDASEAAELLMWARTDRARADEDPHVFGAAAWRDPVLRRRCRCHRPARRPDMIKHRSTKSELDLREKRIQQRRALGCPRDGGYEPGSTGQTACGNTRRGVSATSG